MNNVQLLYILIFITDCDFTAQQTTTRNESFDRNIDNLISAKHLSISSTYSAILILLMCVREVEWREALGAVKGYIILEIYLIL